MILVGTAAQPLSRGVYVAPWIGPKGELVLFAMTSAKTLVSDPVTIPHGASRIGASDALWALLEELDPVAVPRLRVI